MAPEMFLNEPYTAAVNVYALDVTTAHAVGMTLAHKAQIVALARTPLKGPSPPFIYIYSAMRTTRSRQATMTGFDAPSIPVSLFPGEGKKSRGTNQRNMRLAARKVVPGPRG